jgi:hypothetical protein
MRDRASGERTYLSAMSGTLSRGQLVVRASVISAAFVPMEFLFYLSAGQIFSQLTVSATQTRAVGHRTYNSYPRYHAHASKLG